MFLLKLNSNGVYQWHTFYGSSTGDLGYGIAMDESGNVYVAGYSDATWNGPGGRSPLHSYSGDGDIFVLKLSRASSRSDFDGNGKADILWQHPASGTVALWIMNGVAISSVGVPGVISTDWQIMN